MKLLKLLTISIFAFSLSSAFAMDSVETFSASSFKEAQSQGKMIVVDVYKDGCGTCARQQPALSEAKKLYPDAQFVRVNFATDKAAVKKFKAIKQSTIIVFRGFEERGRLLGETNKARILAEIEKGTQV